MAAIALVTGASGGIGEAIAHVMAGEGEDLVLVARSAERLAAVASAIAVATGRRPTVIPVDLAEHGAVDAIRSRLAEEGLVVRHLVNNAGYGLAGDVADLPRDGQCGIVDLNVRALLDLTVAFLPEILAERGGVLNVASVAAFTPGPGLAVYYASKAFVLSFTRALALETAGRGIRVSALCPGPTPTGFGTRAGFRGTRAMALMRPLSAERVAREGVAGYRRGEVVVVPGILNRLLVLALRIVPSAVVLPVLARIQRKRHAAGAVPAATP